MSRHEGRKISIEGKRILEEIKPYIVGLLVLILACSVSAFVAGKDRKPQKEYCNVFMTYTLKDGSFLKFYNIGNEGDVTMTSTQYLSVFKKGATFVPRKNIILEMAYGYNVGMAEDSNTICINYPKDADVWQTKNQLAGKYFIFTADPQ